MSVRTLFTSVTIPSVAVVAACSPVEPNANGTPSQTNSVDIPQTPIENQGKIGFCWSYATLAMVESSYLAHTQKSLNLSEEALGFYHLAEGLLEILKSTHSSAEFLKRLPSGTLPDTSWTRYPTGYADRPENHNQHDALDLIKLYGVVPESVWSFKIPDQKTRTRLGRAIHSRALALAGQGANLTLQDIIDRVLVATEGFPSAPPRSFSWDGQEVEATMFTRTVLGFDPDRFVALMGTSENDFPVITTAVKKALAQGYSVPLGTPIAVARIEDDLFSGKSVPDLNSYMSFAADGGHMMLVTDFVNQGGHPGLTNTEELAKEVARDPYELDYVIVKNSWGTGTKSTDWGMKIAKSDTGFYRIDRDYLRGAIRVAGQDPARVPLVVVVPK